VAAPLLVGGQFEVVVGAAHTAPKFSSTNVRSQSFPKTVQSTCSALSRPTRPFVVASLQLTYGTWILTTPDPTVLRVHNFITSKRRFVREAHLAEEIG
jgi:hypothetical protein